MLFLYSLITHLYYDPDLFFQITHLKLANNLLREIPEIFSNLTNLQNIDLSNNNIKKVHRVFCFRTSRQADTMNYPKKPGFNLYQLRHCACITYSVKTWFLKNLSVLNIYNFIGVFLHSYHTNNTLVTVFSIKGFFKPCPFQYILLF